MPPTASTILRGMPPRRRTGAHWGTGAIEAGNVETRKLLAPSAEGCEQSDREPKKTFSLNNQSEPPKSCGGPGIKPCSPAPALGTNPNTNPGDALDRSSPVAKLEQITPRAFRILEVLPGNRARAHLNLCSDQIRRARRAEVE